MAVANEPLPGATPPPGEAPLPIPQPVVQSQPASPDAMTEARPGNPQPPQTPIESGQTEATPPTAEAGATPSSEAPLPFERQVPEEHRSFLRRFLNRAKEYGQNFVRSKDPRYIASLLNDAEWRKYRLSGAAAGGTASGALAVAGVAAPLGPVSIPAGVGIAAGAILANRVILPKYESYRSKQMERIYSGQELQDRMVKMYGNTGKVRNFAFGTAVGSAAGSMVGHGLAATSSGTAILEGARNFVMGEPQTLVTETMGDGTATHTTVVRGPDMLERAADKIQDVQLPQPDINIPRPDIAIPSPNISLPDLRPPDISPPDLGGIPDAVGDKAAEVRDAAGAFKDEKLTAAGDQLGQTGDKLGELKDSAGALKDEKIEGLGNIKDQAGNTVAGAAEGVKDFVMGDDLTLVTESMGGTHTSIVDEPNMVERAGDKIGPVLGDAGSQLGAAKDALGDWKDDRLADAGAFKDEKLSGAGHLKDQAGNAIGDAAAQAGNALGDTAENVKEFVTGDKVITTDTMAGSQTTVVDGPNMLERAGDHIGPALGTVDDHLGAAGNTIGGAALHAADAVHDAGTVAVNTVDGTIAQAADAVHDAGTEALEHADPRIKEAVENVAAANQEAGQPLNQLMDASSRLGVEARSAVDQAIAHPEEAARNVVTNVTDTVGTALRNEADQTAQEVKGIQDAVSHPPGLDDVAHAVAEGAHNAGNAIDAGLDRDVQLAQELGITGQDVAGAVAIGASVGAGAQIANEMKKNTIVPPPANVKQPGIFNKMKGWLNR